MPAFTSLFDCSNGLVYFSLGVSPCFMREVRVPFPVLETAGMFSITTVKCTPRCIEDRHGGKGWNVRRLGRVDTEGEDMLSEHNRDRHDSVTTLSYTPSLPTCPVGYSAGTDPFKVRRSSSSSIITVL
jgi:hypothetical protein